MVVRALPAVLAIVLTTKRLLQETPPKVISAGSVYFMASSNDLAAASFAVTSVRRTSHHSVMTASRIWEKKRSYSYLATGSRFSLTAWEAMADARSLSRKLRPSTSASRVFSRRSLRKAETSSQVF